MCFHALSKPWKIDKFLFFSCRSTYKIRHYKKDNGNLTINYFIYEFHNNRNIYPIKTEFITWYLLAHLSKIYQTKKIRTCLINGLVQKRSIGPSKLASTRLLQRMSTCLEKQLAFGKKYFQRKYFPYKQTLA